MTYVSSTWTRFANFSRRAKISLIDVLLLGDRNDTRGRRRVVVSESMDGWSVCVVLVRHNISGTGRQDNLQSPSSPTRFEGACCYYYSWAWQDVMWIPDLSRRVILFLGDITFVRGLLADDEWRYSFEDSWRDEITIKRPELKLTYRRFQL